MPPPAAIADIVRQAVERAVNDVMQRRLSTSTAVGRAVATLTADLAAGETARQQSRRELMLAELARVERAGHGRAAVTLVARRFARDRLDPVEVASLARQLRRWRRKADRCPFAVGR